MYVCRGCRVVHDLMVTVLCCVPDCTIMFVSMYILLGCVCVHVVCVGGFTKLTLTDINRNELII